MNCPADNVCIVYPGWALLAAVGAVALLIVIIVVVALVVDWMGRR